MIDFYSATNEILITIETQPRIQIITATPMVHRREEANCRFWYASSRQRNKAYSRRLSKWLCKRKFSSFGEGADFRLGAYAIGTDKIELGANVVIRPGSMLFASPLDANKSQIVIEESVLRGAGSVVTRSIPAYSVACGNPARVIKQLDDNG